MCSGRATPVARERNPTAPHAQECVPDVQRRSRGSATLPRHIPKNVFHTCNVGRCRALPTEGIEPTHCCQYWILSPARLPIPPRRLFARRQLLIRLQPNASTNDAIPQLLSRRISQELQEFRRITGNKCLVESTGSRVEFMAWKLMNHRHRPKSRLILQLLNS